MFLSAVSVLVVAQSSSEILEGLMNNPVFTHAVSSTYINSLTNNLGLQVRAYHKRPIEIRFKYLGNKQICDIFKTCRIISVLFSMKCRLFHNFIFFFRFK